MRRLVFAFVLAIMAAGCNDEGKYAFSKGMSYLTGGGCVKDEDMAVAWFEKAAKKGNADAKEKLGECRGKGIGLSRDTNAAAGWYLDAIKAGKLEAADALTDILIADSNIVCDVSIVADALEKLALRDNSGKAYYQLGRLHNSEWLNSGAHDGREYMLKSAEKGYTQAMFAYGLSAMADDDQEVRKAGRDYLDKAANGDNVDAQRLLAHCYANGFLLDRDDEMALKWEIRAAKNGDGEMLTKLGRRYWIGYGVATDQVEAVRFFKKAVMAKYPDAAVILGELYSEGVADAGVEKDLYKAFELFKMSADAGHVDGTFDLGYAYFHGLGVEPNKQKAVAYYRIAAEGGHGEAQRLLGIALMKGMGGEKDVDKARFWFRKASEGGSTAAMCSLAWSYYDTETARWSDRDEARKWLNKAADAGDERAKKSLEFVN